MCHEQDRNGPCPHGAHIHPPCAKMQSCTWPAPALSALRNMLTHSGHNMQLSNIDLWEIPEDRVQNFRGLINYGINRSQPALSSQPESPLYSLVHSRRFTSRDVLKKYHQRTKKMMPRGITGIAVQGIAATITPTTPTTRRNVWKSKNRCRGLLMKGTCQR